MKRSRRTLLSAASLAPLLPRPTFAQAADESIDRHLPELDGLADAALHRTGVPGLSIAMVRHDPGFDGAWLARFTRNADAQSPAGGVRPSARDTADWLPLRLGRG